jgi:plastocyanin
MRKLLIIAAASVAALPSGSALPAEQMHAIAMKGVAFAPATITAKVGDTLEWDNGDIVAHTALVQNCYPGLGQRHGGAYRATPSFSG